MKTKDKLKNWRIVEGYSHWGEKCYYVEELINGFWGRKWRRLDNGESSNSLYWSTHEKALEVIYEIIKRKLAKLKPEKIHYL